MPTFFYDVPGNVKFDIFLKISKNGENKLGGRDVYFLIISEKNKQIEFYVSWNVIKKRWHLGFGFLGSWGTFWVLIVCRYFALVLIWVTQKALTKSLQNAEIWLEIANFHPNSELVDIQDTSQKRVFELWQQIEVQNALACFKKSKFWKIEAFRNF